MCNMFKSNNKDPKEDSYVSFEKQFHFTIRREAAEDFALLKAKSFHIKNINC